MPATPHIKLLVTDLGRQTRFYTGIFGSRPTLVTTGSAVWITENPPLRFEISAESGYSRQFVRSGPV